MARAIFTEEHEEFRDMVRSFIEKEIAPYHAQWEKDGIVSRQVWEAAGRQGLLGIEMPEEYGGGGNTDYRYYAVFNEELAKASASGPGFAVHNDVCGGYLLGLLNDEQKARWLPGYCSGELIAAIAMTEPAAGSDLQGIKSTAILDGDDYVLNGSKTFITNGILSDIVIVAAKTDPSAGARGVSLLVVERGMEGFSRGRNLDKVGMHAQDTAELFFDAVRVPKANLLGEEGMGFIYLMQNLARERLCIAVSAVAGAQSAFEQTLEYAKTREAFGRPIGKFQHNRFTLAEIKTEITVSRAFLDQCIDKESRGELDAEEASMVKYWTTEMLKTVVDRCVQLHGGYGYMNEYPIAKAYQDVRIQTIFGGTTEIMKEIIGRGLGI
ncbi:acyl-CoA dehydrogenase family protein [Actinomadura parmotrematis]|uniref:Acyl-CoA dehydrogenase family protein n=1 Tax=Actinomadura parmotrematis TaxID=2864039 RepID=A0ABS7FM44_9ACTN|nr:acyl-CoA dehydrogenase family protein [Actinomadura parmotrematis]MBW8481421.1 acyl-CoA dehydrogenase family protein [Actinomadura parmotrematis]